MKTEFLSHTNKIELINHLEQGKKEAIDIAVNELDRLEVIIRSYESVMQQVALKLDDHYVKNVENQILAIKNL